MSAITNKRYTKSIDGSNGTIDTINKAEQDPTVSDWAKQEEKPTYTPEEIGAAAIDDVSITVDNNVGTPSGTGKLENRILKLDLRNIKGEPGASAVFDPNTGNILATLESTLGKSKSNAMTQEAVTNEILADREWELEEIDLSSLTLRNYMINSDTTSSAYGKWKSGGAASNSCWVFKVTPGDIIRVTPTTSRYEVAFLRTFNYSANTLADFTGGVLPAKLRYTVETDFVVPDDANYMYVVKMFSSTDRSPARLGIVRYTRNHIQEIEDALFKVKGELSDVSIYKIEEITLPSTGTGTALNYITNDLLWHGNTTYYSGLVIEVEAGATYKIVPPAGNRVRYAWLSTNGRTAGSDPSFIEGQGTILLGQKDETLYVTAPDGAHYIYLNRKGYSAVTPSFFGKMIYVKNALTEIEGVASSIDKNTLAFVKQAAYKRAGSDSATSLPYFKLLHFSDIHGSTLASTNIKNAIDALSPYLNDTICTGDAIYATVGGSYSGENYWPNCGLADKVLFTLGNHDDLLSTSTYEREDKEWSHDLYFADYIDDLGYTMPNGYDDSSSPNYKACFWHKDYADQKVRLIGLDCRNKFNGVVDPATGEVTVPDTDTSNEQELWLVARLAETLANSGDAAAGYSVVIAGHYPLDGYDVDTNGENIEWDDITHEWIYNHKSTGGRIINQKTGDVSNWHRYSQKDYVPEASMRWANSSNVNNIGEIIKYYMSQQGSNFAAYLCGHTHTNLFFYPKKYPNILNICIDMAGELRNMTYADQGTMGGYIANYLSFATSSKIIKLVRLGVKSDLWLTPLNYLCYDYGNRKIIQEG